MESLKSREIGRLCMLYKIINFEIPKYLHHIIPLSDYQQKCMIKGFVKDLLL